MNWENITNLLEKKTTQSKSACDPSGRVDFNHREMIEKQRGLWHKLSVRLRERQRPVACRSLFHQGTANRGIPGS